jgi:hypothetical protein
MKLLLILGSVCEISELSILTLMTALEDKEARLWSYVKLLHKSYKNNDTGEITEPYWMMSGNLNDSRAHIMIIHASNEGAYI